MNHRTRRTRYSIFVVALIMILGLAHLVTQRIAMAPLQALIEKRLTEAVGLEITFGRFRAGLLPTPHLDAEKVRIANFSGSKSPDLLRIEHVELGLAFWPLFDRIIEIDRLSIEGADLFLETDAEGQFTLGDAFDAKAGAAAPGDFRLVLRQLHLETLYIVYRDLRRDAPHTLVFDSVAVDSKFLGSETTIEARGQFDDSDIEISGEIGSLAEVFAPERSFPVDLQGQIFEAQFEAKGSVEKPRTLEGLELDITAEIPELVVAGRPLPRLGTVHFTGRLSNRDGSLGLESLSLKAAPAASARVDVQGRMDDLLHLTGIDVDAHIETGALDFLAPAIEPQFEPFLRAVASFSARAKLSDASGTLGLEGSGDASSAGKAIVVHAKGGSKDLKRLADIAFDVEARSDDMTSMTALFPDIPEHGPLGAVTARAHIESHEHSLRADGIEIRMGEREKIWGELDGSISDVIALEGVDLELLFGASSLHHLREVLAREFPETSAFEGAAGIHDKDGSLRLKHARLHGGRDSRVEIHADARLNELPGRDDVEIDLALRGEDMSVLGAIVGMDLPPVRPVEFSGRFRGPPDKVDVDGLALQLGESHFVGSLSGSYAGRRRPKLEARLSSKDVRLQDLGFVPSDENPTDSADDDSRPWPNPHDELPFEDLRHVDLDLDVQLDRVGGYQGFESKDIRFKLTLDDGLLDVTDVRALYQEGEFQARLRADARTPVPKIELSIDTKGMNIERVMAQFDQNPDYSGLIDTEIDLQARGETTHALKRSLNGSVGVAIRDGNAVSRIARAFVVNLAVTIFRGWRRGDVPKVGCAVTYLEVENGIATVDTLLLKGAKITVTGTGEVDLVRGEYDLHVVPRNSNPGIVSLAPDVEVTGPLLDPQFRAVKRTLVTSFGRGLVHNTFKAGGTVLNPFGFGRKSMQKQEEVCRLTGGVDAG